MSNKIKHILIASCPLPPSYETYGFIFFIIRRHYLVDQMLLLKREHQQFIALQKSCNFLFDVHPYVQSIKASSVLHIGSLVLASQIGVMYFCVFGFLKRHIIKQIGDMMFSALFLHAYGLHFSSPYLFLMKLCPKIGNE